MGPAELLTPDELKRVESAIATAERATTAEIRVVTLRWCWAPIHLRAIRLFHKLGLDRTREQNAVLIVLVRANREFMIYGDRGITSRVGPGYWFDVRDVMVGHFRRNRIADGLCEGVAMIGGKLAEHFRPLGANENELEDAVVQEE